MLFQIPGQDAIIPLPDNAPNQDEVADAGGGVLNFLAGYPALVAAAIVAYLLYKGWQNMGIRILMISIGVVIVTLMVTQAG